MSMNLKLFSNLPKDILKKIHIFYISIYANDRLLSLHNELLIINYTYSNMFGSIFLNYTNNIYELDNIEYCHFGVIRLPKLITY